MTRAHADRPVGYDACNVYTTIIIDEARRRGLDVEVLDPTRGELRLSDGTTTRVVLESLCELLSAVAHVRCEDKVMSRRVLAEHGLPIPPGHVVSGDAEDEAFLDRHGEVVVKPARGEGGEGVTVGVADRDGLRDAIELAQRHHPTVLCEALVSGEDLRVLVIGGEVVAAAVRRPPQVTGDGSRTVRGLVEEANRRREASAGTGVAIPADERTEAVLDEQALSLDAVPDRGRVVLLRRTANVHTGGTIDDVTDLLHPRVGELALRACAAFGAPLLGVDVIVPTVDAPDGHIIEVNPQAGLANHGSRPTAARFVDLLF